MITQKSEVLYHLQKGFKLTGLQALKKFGVMRLAAVVFDLRQEGYDIKSRDVEVETRRGKTTVTEYSIPVKGKQEGLF